MTNASLLQGILDAATGEAIWAVDGDGVVLYANEAAVRRFDGIGAGMVGRSVAELLSPPRSESLLALVWRTVQSGEPTRYEEEVDGLTLQHHFHPVREEGRIGAVACFTRDATERDSDDRLRIAKDAALLGIYDHDLVADRLDWDDRVRELLGVGPDELVTFDLFMSALHPEDRAATQREIDRAMDPAGGGAYAAEFRVVRSGTVRWVAATGQVFFSSGRAVRIVGTVQDVTERKRFQDRLLESERKLRVALESAELGTFELDPETELFSWDARTAAMLQVGADESPNLRIGASRLSPEDWVRVKAALAAAYDPAGDGRYEAEFDVRRPDGTSVSLLAKGRVLFEGEGAQRRPVRLHGVNMDVSERKRAAAALVASEERARRHAEELQNLMEMAPVAIWVSHDPTCSTITGNRAAAEMYETDARTNVSAGTRDGSTVISTERRFYCGDRELTPDELPMQIAARTGKQVLNFELGVLLPSGRRITMLGNARPLFDGQNRVRGCLGVYLDITERKEAEEALRTAHAELEERVSERTGQLQSALQELHEKEHMLILQSRVAAMGEMISNIAHQWRQPLNALGLLVQRLGLFYDRDEMNPEVLHETIAKAMKLILHMSGTIDDFRNFFRPDKERVEFRVTEVVGDAIRLVESAFSSARIRISTRYDEEPVVHGYPGEFSQVILNILHNAKEAFEVRNGSNAVVTVRVDACEGRARVVIADNAGGIPEEVIGKVFEPHFTTKQTHGTGIGLFMSKTIIEKNMNGRLSVRNAEGGAEFCIEV